MAKSVDPVCGMELDPGQIEAQSMYQGTRYDFCSGECKRMFDENLQEYVPADARDTAPPRQSHASS